MTPSFADGLCCAACGGSLELRVFEGNARQIGEGCLRCPCGRVFPVIAGIPRLLPDDLMSTVEAEHPDFYAQHPELRRGSSGGPAATLSTLRAFGDEWRRFPELHAAHHGIFRWYFDGAGGVRWSGLRALDAGCGMGRWLHFARQEGANVVGMDVSPAIDVVAARDGGDLVQADLRHPPFLPESFDLVFSLGVLHHLEDPLVGVRALARLVRPGGELRFYVYRSLEGEPWPRRALLAIVTGLRRLTTRLPYALVHLTARVVAGMATVLFLWPRRLFRHTRAGDRLTRGLPLVQYTDVPFRMLVAEQFDRLVAPIEGRFRREEVEGWVRAAGLELSELLPGLGWRVVARRPATERW